MWEIYKFGSVRDIKQSRKVVKMSTRQKRTLFVFFIIILGIFLTATLLINHLIKPKDLNVILITIDSLRPDHLGCYGYKRNTSPIIDKLAKESVLFSQAIVQGHRTPLSLPSLHTSTYPRTHGVYREGFKISPSLPTLAEILKKNGYWTKAICFFEDNITGLERGFDVFTGGAKTDLITKTAISWLEKNQNNKFFLWIHYLDPHSPYLPPAPYNSMFLKFGSKNMPISNNPLDGYKAIPVYVAENNITDIDYYISQYDGEIRFVDEQLGILLQRIKELNLDKNSILILTADHGESMGEHNDYFMHGNLYDEIIKVPLFVKCEKIIPRAKIISHQVQLIDIAPTILNALSISKPKSMQGSSLLPLILKNKRHPSFFAFTELAASYKKIKELSKESVRTNEWKLIYTKDIRNNNELYELYNLNLDPGENDNLIEKETNTFNFLKTKLDYWRNKIPCSESIAGELTEEMKKALKSLGYL